MPMQIRKHLFLILAITFGWLLPDLAQSASTIYYCPDRKSDQSIQQGRRQVAYPSLMRNSQARATIRYSLNTNQQILKSKTSKAMYPPSSADTINFLNAVRPTSPSFNRSTR